MKRLYIVSSGAGGINYITSEAKEAIEQSEVIVCYSKYARELDKLIEGKELYTSGMTYEIQRCKQAIDYAKKGKTTSIISNGDANVFGIATIIVELIDKQDLWEEIELITLPGVTSFLATAAKVGAPISQDFALISLSNKIADTNITNERIKACLDTDFILGIYNPKSKKRVKAYENFLDILAKYEQRIVIIAQHIGRKEKEKITITTTKELIKTGITNPNIGMSTLLIVCNLNTRLTKNGLVLASNKLSKELK